MKNFLASVVIIASLASACSKDENHPPTADQPKSFRLNGLSEAAFLDNSSELRCEALRQFLVSFANEILIGGTVDQFSCVDMSGVDSRFVFKAQLTKDEKTSVIVQHIAGSTALETEYCDLPFDGTTFETCNLMPFFQSIDTGTRAEGFSLTGLASLQDALSQYVSQKQTKDLAFGIQTTVFADQWVSKLDGTYSLPLRSPSEPISLKVKLNAGPEGFKAGAATIVEAIQSQEGSLFGCANSSCLVERSYNYIFNGHHLVLKTADGQSLSLSLSKID